MKIYKIAQQSIGQLDSSLILNYVNTNKWDLLSNYLYDTIRKKAGVTSDFTYKATRDPKNATIVKYYEQLALSAHKSNPEWIQWDISKSFPKAGKDFKLYFTPDDQSCMKLLSGLTSLFTSLVPISQKYQTNIDFKIPALFAGYLSQNDRLVIHFTNQQATQDIQQIVNQWAGQNGITMGKRTHNLGQDVDKESFGQRIASNIVNTAKQYMDSKKYTPEQIVQWIVKYFPTMLKDIR